MKQIYKDFLFTRHILVNDELSNEKYAEKSLATLITLGRMFNIRITKNMGLATESMIHDCEKNLGSYVPEPFYRGFPKTVLQLTPDQLLFDQLVHYTQTYGFGFFNNPGHSFLENSIIENFERTAFNENITPKNFEIHDSYDASQELIFIVKNILKSNRPQNPETLAVILEMYKERKASIMPDWIPCKDTVIYLLVNTHDISLCKYLVLSDVIKVLDYIQYNSYMSENLKKLNLKNKDRKFLKDVIDWFFTDSFAKSDKAWRHYIDIPICHEKRKIWCGLLHHIHYKAPNITAEVFVKSIREGKNLSYLSAMETAISTGDPLGAAEVIQRGKGSGELMRRLNYILSRCENEQEAEEVLKCLE